MRHIHARLAHACGVKLPLVVRDVCTRLRQKFSWTWMEHDEQTSHAGLTRGPNLPFC